MSTNYLKYSVSNYSQNARRDEPPLKYLQGTNYSMLKVSQLILSQQRTRSSEKTRHSLTRQTYFQIYEQLLRAHQREYEPDPSPTDGTKHSTFFLTAKIGWPPQENFFASQKQFTIISARTACQLKYQISYHSEQLFKAFLWFGTQTIVLAQHLFLPDNKTDG